MAKQTAFEIEQRAKLKAQRNRIKSKVNESYVVQAKNNDVKSFAVTEKPLQAHEELFEGYIEALNKVSAKLDAADRSVSNSNSSEFRSLKIDEAFNSNAAFLHSLYFDNIGHPESSVAIDSIAYMRLSRDWGSFDAWQEDFIACGLASRSGWVLTVYNVFLQRYMNVVLDLHNINVPVGCLPVIALDCWEHTYFKDYLKNRKAFIYKSMQEFNWDVIEKRIKQADQVAKIYGSK
jgi:superoxide dismutase, Fe-Mn family